jgi:hypothetical protein
MTYCIGCDDEFERGVMRDGVRYKGNYCRDCEENKDERVNG